MQQKQRYFVKVNDADERLSLYQDLAKLKKEFSAKSVSPQTELFSLRANDYNEPNLECTVMGAPGPLPEDETLIIQFQIGSEKYLSQVNFKTSRSDRNTVFINTNSDVFHLQRRENFRIRVPNAYKATLHLEQWQQGSISMLLDLLDVSGGGCLVIFNPRSLDLKTGHILKGQVKLGNRDPFTITCEVRHIRKDPTKEDFLLAGLKFIDITEKEKNKVIAMVMDLYREIFKRGI